MKRKNEDLPDRFDHVYTVLDRDATLGILLHPERALTGTMPKNICAVIRCCDWEDHSYVMEHLYQMALNNSFGSYDDIAEPLHDVITIRRGYELYYFFIVYRNTDDRASVRSMSVAAKGKILTLDNS
ncbi:unnamed protein product [Sphagnum troendelagicum]